MSRSPAEILKEHAARQDDGSYEITLKPDSFDEAMYQTRSKDQLYDDLGQETPNIEECEEWNITPELWRWGLERAIAAHLIDEDNSKTEDE